MKKELPKNTPEVSASGINFVERIKDSQYIVLVDGSVARLLKPSIKNGKKYYNLRIKGTVSQYDIDDLKKLAK